MNITLAQYTIATEMGETENNGIRASIDGISVYVPLDPANRHYQAIQEWVAEGNTIADAD